MPLVSTFGNLSARGFGFGAAAKAFTPLSLFAAGEQGVWYDPSDLTTMFEDTAGTTPVHTPGNGTADSPVGLLLDKRNTSILSQNFAGGYLNCGASSAFAMGTGDFTWEAWIYFTALPSGYQMILSTRPSSSTSSDAGCLFVNSSGGIGWYTSGFIVNYTTSIGLNQWVHVAVSRSGTTLRVFAAGSQVGSATNSDNLTANTLSIGANNNGAESFLGYISNARVVKGTAVYTANFTPPTSPLTAISGTSVLTCGTTWSGNPSITTYSGVQASGSNPFGVVGGNHAIQSTGTARPTLSALYNLQRYTEAFSDGSWTKQNLSVTSSTETSPIGTSTACLISSNTTTNQHNIYRGVGTIVANTQYTLSFSAKLVDSSRPYIAAWIYFASGGPYVTYNLNDQTVASSGVTASNGTFVSSSITSQGNGWYRITLVGYGNYTSAIPVIDLRSASALVPNTSFAGSGLNDAYIWGMDFRVTNDGVGLPAYQRVADANTYDSTGFPYYLKFDGVDDYLSATGTWLNSVGGFDSFLASRNLNTNNQMMFSWGDFSGAGYSNDIWLGYLSGMLFQVDNGTEGGSTDASARTIPSSNLDTSRFDGSKSGTSRISRRVNGSGVSLTFSYTPPATTANRTSPVLVIGTYADNPSGYYSKENVFGFILRVAVSSSTDVSNTETWMNGKAKIY